MSTFAALQLILLIGLTPFLPAFAAPPSAENNIVSVNVVSDEIILGLAPYCPDLKQRVLLSPLANEKRYAAIAHQVAQEKWPQIQDLESALKAKVKLAIVSSYNKVEWVQQFKKIGATLVFLEDTASLAAVRRNIKKVGDALACPVGVKALEQEWDEILAQTKGTCRHETVLLLPEEGFVYGEGTLINDSLLHLGLSNAVQPLHVTGISRVQSEALASLKPSCFMASGTSGDQAKLWDMLVKQAVWKKAPALQNRCLALIPGYLLSSGSQHVLALLTSLRENLPACSPAPAGRTR